MTIRRYLVPVATAALLLTACAGDDVEDTTDGAATEQPADDATDEPAEDATDEPADDTTEEPTEDTTDDSSSEEEPTEEDAAAGGTQPATVALTFDGQAVPIATACNGVDGAVLATTEGEVTITLVQEEGIALRYQGEGMTAETDQVEVEEIGESTVYRATLESDEVPAVDVELELGDTSVLDDC